LGVVGDPHRCRRATEAADVVPDNEIRLCEEGDELTDLVFLDDQELIAVIAIGYAYRHSEAMELAAPANLCKGALGFEVEHNDLFVPRHFPLRVLIEEVHLTVPVLQCRLRWFSCGAECSTAPEGRSFEF